MNRQTHKLQQGSPEWHAFRAKHFGASELPAATGVSKYTTRGDLVKEKATGISKEIDARTQALFDKGHAAEEAGRILAELIIGETLSPKVMSIELDGLPLSASLDGISDDGLVVFEHKLWSEKLAEAVKNNDLDPHYCMQLDQQLLVSGAKKVLFMTSDGTEENMAWMWYDAAQADYEEICNTWKQFAADVAAYVPVEVIEKPQADAIKALPSVVIQVSGTLTNCNLDDVTPKFDTFLAKAEEGKANIDIHNGTAIAKFSREAASDCKLTAKAVVSQMASVSDAVNTLELYSKKFDAMGLAYEKEVDRLKEIEKAAALNKAKAEYAEHLAALQAEIHPINLVVPVVDFAAAIKGLKTVESKNNALNVALANGKIAADAVAKETKTRLAWFKDEAKGYEFLFPDLQQLIYI